MLTAELVNARRSKGELRITPLPDALRPRAIELATAFVAIAREHVGRSREDFEDALSAVVVAPKERRIADALRKLVEDRCDFDADEALDPEALRREVFLAAAERRRDGAADLSFDRAEVLGRVAAAHEMSPEGLEQALYADLRAAHLLRTVRAMTGPALVLGFDLAQAQAVLLRAVRVVAFVGCEGPGAYRALFGKLKFLRLLHRIERAEDDTYRIEIDGPFSLFESVTRYGLQLALSLPIIASSAHYRLEADVRWGKEREALTLRLEGGREHSRAKPRQAESLGPSATAERSSEESGEEPARLADEVEVLLAALEALCEGGAVRVARCYEVLHVPGASVCVPDLVFEHRKSRRRVYLEVMGYWSRDAVWKRVELIEGGLDERVLFAVGKHLRVSEAALDDEASGALYVYKRTMHARTVLERVEALLARKKRESKPAAPST